MRARKFMRRLKHGPFLAFVIDEGKDRVHYFHTEGIDHTDIGAIRAMLDELEAKLLGR